MDVQVDRLSNLPNDLIHKILSFIDVKYAIRTIALSSRYRFIWTSLPYLNFSDDDFWLPFPRFSNENSLTLEKFSEFVTRVLSGRDTKIEVHSLKLSFHGDISQVPVKDILNYAFSHNVQQMTVTYMNDWNLLDFPLSLFTSQSLKNLTLSNFGKRRSFQINCLPTWGLPALTTLHLDDITFTDEFTDLLSKCSNLKNLFLSYCHMINQYDICHPRLSNLTLNHGYCDYGHVLNVDAPRLKYLTIKDGYLVHLSSAPKLHSLLFKGHYTHTLKISSNALCSLEKADLCLYGPIPYYKEGDAHEVVDLLQQVRSVKYLRLNMETIQILSSFKELISHQPFSFPNLKSVKVSQHEWEETMPIEMNLPKSYSGATLTFVCQEIIALRNAISAQNYMAQLWKILEEEKARCEKNTTLMDSHDTKMHEKVEEQVENEKLQPVEKKALDIEGKMEKIEICWKDLGFQINKGIGRTSCIFYMLREAEKLLLKELHTSKRNMSRLDNHETHMLEKGEAQVENEKAQPVEKKALDIEGKMEKIDICLTDLRFQINKGIARTSYIFYMLCEAEKLLLEELHTSKRDMLQARFTSLQAEVDIVVKKIIDGMRIQFDEKAKPFKLLLS